MWPEWPRWTFEAPRAWLGSRAWRVRTAAPGSWSRPTGARSRTASASAGAASAAVAAGWSPGSRDRARGGRGVGLRGAVRGRPARRSRRRGSTRAGLADAGHRPRGVRRGATTAIANSMLWFVHHLLYDTPGAGLRRGVPRPVGGVRGVQRGVRRRAGRGGGRGRRACSCRTTTWRWSPRMLRAAAPRPADRPLLAHPVGPARLLPAAARRHRPRQVLRGLLGADRAGFLTRRWADAFAALLRGRARARRSRPTAPRSRTAGARRGVDVHALGVDGAGLRRAAAEPDVHARMAALRGRGSATGRG